MPKVVGETMSGKELRRRVDALGPKNYVEAADWLGLTRSGLEKAMTGQRTITRQTQIILRHLEDKKALADHFTRKLKKSMAGLTKTFKELDK